MATYTSNINIKAPASKVFDALTQPELVKQWQYGKLLTTDWQVGGAIRFSAEYEGKMLEQWGTILDLRPNELVKYNLFTPRPNQEDKIENYTITSYVLTQQDGITHIQIIHEDNRPQVFAPQSLKGILVALRNIAEAD
ncbi:ATPase [Paraflavitalea soli]|uniref:ATPase n=1 Tax=Paraflavitalea soli TaxID=2315862 RepID=A0A3B7MNC9_9BACT|nr:SRPBCC family protein [Paraflavitalea soli]AXY74869.1 ATPase [Paraflavitalea soli]